MSSTYTIAVAGNPNSGKTCIFNNLTGGTQQVGNYPGVTVEFVEGHMSVQNTKITLVDLPGTYSLAAYSQEEVVARDYVLNEKPDLILNVVDASNLERNLYLTVQLIELRVPMVICLNMVDVAEKKGTLTNVERLAELLGLAVVPSIARQGHGMDKLKETCLKALQAPSAPKPLAYSHELQGSLKILEESLAATNDLGAQYPRRWLALKMLEDDERILSLVNSTDGTNTVTKALDKAKKCIEIHSGEDSVTAVAEARYAIASGATKECVQMSETKKQMLTDQIDSIVCHRFFGPLILLGVVYALFVFVFKLADETQWIPLLNGSWTSPKGIIDLLFEQLSASAYEHISSDMIRSLICDGIIGGVGGVMSFVPLIFFMFLFIAVLEDTGYIARIAFILDRVLRAFGLQGKSILAMIVSGGLSAGCAVPGVMATRTLREEKDRLVTILVAPLMNCGAKMPVHMMLIAAFFASARSQMMFLLWLLSWVFALAAAYVIRRFVVRGEQTPFVMELPVYHLPTLRGVLMHTWNRTWLYIKKAGTVILAINIVLWALMYFPRADVSEQAKSAEASVRHLQSQAVNTEYAGIVASQRDLDATSEFLSEYREAQAATDKSGRNQLLNQLRQQDTIRYSFAQQIQQMAASERKEHNPAVSAYQAHAVRLEEIAAEKAKIQLSHSIAGRLGSLLEPVSSLAGFDWKDNIALIGGFLAKEVIVGTLGTAYSMGDVDPEQSEPLSLKLANDPSWTRLRAFCLMLFVMIYSPCCVTIATIRKETNSWKWAMFATAYTTVMAFIVATVVYQLGNLFT